MLGFIKKLDWYILKKFLGTFFYTVLLFTAIAIVIDCSEKIGSFLENKLSVKVIIVSYYLNFVPYINALLWPMFTLIAVIFFTSRMAANAEVISMLNAGMSFWRFLRPYIIGALFIMLIHLAGNHYFVPTSNKARIDFENTYVYLHNENSKTNDVHIVVDSNTMVYVRYYRKQDTIANDFRLEQYKAGELKKVIECRTAKWIGPPNRWRLEGATIRTFDGLKESYLKDNDWRLDTSLNMFPKDFIRYKNQKEKMTSAELKTNIADGKTRGVGLTTEYEIEIYRRTADSFTIFILTIMGAAVSSRKVRGGLGLHLAFGILLGAAYIILSKFAITFALSQYIPALLFLGVWTPNIIFISITWYLISKAQK